MEEQVYLTQPIILTLVILMDADVITVKAVANVNFSFYNFYISGAISQDNK